MSSSLTRTTVRPFNQKQIELVETFADQAVIAIENVRLFDEVQARTRDLTESLQQQTATADVLKVISRSTFDLQTVLDTLVESAARLCEAPHGLIFRFDGTSARAVAAFNNVPGFKELWAGNPILPNRGTATGRAIVERRVVHIPDVLTDPDYAPPEGALKSAQKLGQYRTTLVVPMLREAVIPLGTITLWKTEVEAFTDKQIELVTTFADQAVIAIENVRLFEEVQSRTRELEESLKQQTATADVLKAISRSAFDLQPVLETLVQSATLLCEADHAWLFRRDGKLFHWVAGYGHVAEVHARLREYFEPLDVPVNRGSVTGRAALDAKVVQVADVLADPEYTWSGAQEIGRYRAAMGVPLLRNDEVIGVIFVGRTRPQSFTEKQVELATTFADQAVIAIENARLFEEVQFRTAELTEALEQQTATSEVLQAISRATFDLQTVLDTLVQSAARLCDAEIGTITRERAGTFFREALYGFSPEFIEFVRSVPVQPERGNVSGRALLEGRIIQIEDVDQDPEYTWDQARQLGHFRTLLGVPLLRQGKPIGVMSLGRRAVRPFSQKQIDLAGTFADQAVIAIENVRLFDEVQARTRDLARSVDELRALGEVSHAVNSTLDLETVLSTIVAKAVQLSATEAGAIYVFSKLRQKFRLRATYGMSEAMIAEIGKQGVGLGESYIGKATQSGEAVQVPDLVTEPASPIRDLVLNAGYRALLVVPLLRPGRVVGALVVRRKEPGLFLTSTIDLLQTFAAQSVLAIQNARLFEDVEARTRELAKSLEELRAAQERLIQTEKLASLGQLTAGIAHEIKNPLNFVNNFAALSIELIDELKPAIVSARQGDEQTAELMELLAGNLEKVVQHGKRADSIVKNMLLHSRAGSGERRVADINALVEESLNLAYHGARAEKQGFNITIERFLDPAAGEVDLFPQEITRVLLNLISNSFYATMKRKEGANGPYEPTLSRRDERPRESRGDSDTRQRDRSTS